MSNISLFFPLWLYRLYAIIVHVVFVDNDENENGHSTGCRFCWFFSVWNTPDIIAELWPIRAS